MGDASDGYRAAREAAAWAWRPDRRVLGITGGEALDFLQRMTTRDLRGMGPGEVRTTCLADRMGKTLGVATLAAHDGGFTGVADEGCAGELAKKLSMYVLGADVAITLADEEVAVAEVLGPEASARLELDGATRRGAVLGFPHPARGIPGATVVGPRSDLEALAHELGVPELPPDEHRLLRVEAGVPVFGVDYDGEHMPTEAGFAHAVSYDKGCYMGQEIFERMRSRGVRTRDLFVLELGGGASAEPAVSKDGKVLGTMTSAVPAPGRDATLGLAILPVKSVAPGDTVEVDGRKARVAAPPGTEEGPA